MKTILFFLSFLLWMSAACPALTAAEPTRVLFVGNSYSFKVPGLFQELAKSGGKNVEVVQMTKGGWTLAKHSASKETMQKIRGAKWDIVIFKSSPSDLTFHAQLEAKSAKTYQKTAAKIAPPSQPPPSN